MLYRKIYLWLSLGCLWLLPTLIFGQSKVEIDVISAEGEAVEAGLFHVKYSVGEPRVSTLEGGGFTLTEGFIQPDLFALFEVAPGDSVWPGDANADLGVDMFDLLPIGLAYGKQGPHRLNATINWEGQIAANWSDTLDTGVNYKHIDCNGDGVINDNDTLAIHLNYGLTSNKNLGTEETNGPTLFTKIKNDSLVTGDTARIEVHFGEDTLPVTNLYGIAFSLEMDTNLVKDSTVSLDFSNSWLGTKNQNMLTMVKPFFGDNQVDIALTRIDHIDQAGYGLLCEMIIMIDDLSGKNEVDELFKIEVKNVRGITAEAELLEYSLGADSITITNNPTSIVDQDWLGLEVYPNPAREETRVILTNPKPSQVKVFDLNGKIVWQSGTFRNELTIPTAKIASGIYLLEIENRDSRTTRKLSVKH